MWHMYIYIYIYVYTYMYIHIYIYAMVYYSGIKKNEILPFVTMWIELEGWYAKLENEIYDFIHVWNLRNTTDEHGGREGKIR